MAKKLIAPSVLSADFANLERDVKMLNESDADYIHIDIMDGVFVPNISFGFPVCKAIHKHAKKPMDFHLMVADPNPYLQNCIDTGAEIISVHYETCPHLHRTISEIKKLGAKAGVVLNPHSPVELLNDIITEIDLVLIMSVNPGFGGQKFIQNTYDKVAKLKVLKDKFNPNLLIEIDGGVNGDNASRLFNSGADMLVAGSYVFGAENPKEAIKTLKK